MDEGELNMKTIENKKRMFAYPRGELLCQRLSQSSGKVVVL